MPTREICKCCWAINSVGFHVPNAVWDASVPLRLNNDVLCLNCFTRFADEAGVQWDEIIEFFPVSRVTHELDDTIRVAGHDKECVAEFESRR